MPILGRLSDFFRLSGPFESRTAVRLSNGWPPSCF
jgi:hypothetical protein